MKLYIGCDVGTSGTKAVAVDERGAVRGTASNTYGIIQKHGNWAEQDPDRWLSGALDALRELIGKIEEKNIAGICISALYGGTGALCDKDLRPVRPALIWMDRRAERQSKRLRETIGTEAIFEVTNNGIDSYFGYTKLLWVKENEPENWEKIAHVLPASSYIVYKLCGRLCIDYSSGGNFGGLYDYKRHAWSEELCDKLGLPLHLFPGEFMAPYEKAGLINEAYKRELGLSHDVYLCTGTIDCIASMLSAGALSPGDNAAVLGTSLNWGILHEGLSDSPSVISMPYAVSPKTMSYTYGGASTAGALPRWFVKGFLGEDSDASYSQMERELEQTVPGSGGLTMLPYFMGERNPIWDEQATGVLFGLTLSHTRADIYRAILESVAFSLLHIMDSMEFLSKRTDKIILVGGGTKSTAWKRIFADVTGLPVLSPKSMVEAPLGDAYMAAYADGAVAGFAGIRDWIEFEDALQPDEKNHRLYERYYALYKGLYEDLKNRMQERDRILKETAS